MTGSVRPSGVADVLRDLIVERLHAAHCNAVDCLARWREEQDADIAIAAFVEFGLLDQASASPIVQPEAASTVNDRPSGGVA